MMRTIVRMACLVRSETPGPLFDPAITTHDTTVSFLLLGYFPTLRTAEIGRDSLDPMAC